MLAAIIILALLSLGEAVLLFLMATGKNPLQGILGGKEDWKQPTYTGTLNIGGGQSMQPQQDVGFSYTAREDFLQNLIKATAVSDVGQAAKSVVQELLKEPSLSLRYVSLMQWNGHRKQMQYLGTNLPKMYLQPMMKHINEIQAGLLQTNALGHSQFSENGVLHYPSAAERGIAAEYYIPLYHGNDLIGGIMLEGTDLRCRSVFNLDFFKLIVSNLELVLYNILLVQQVYQQANTDNLTQLYNRAYMQHFGEQLLADKANYAVMIMDIDFFKKCNDVYGHAVGDIVLREVAARVKASAREGEDGVFRYGGEEFVVVLRDVDANLAVQRAEHIRRSIEMQPIRYELDKTLSVTISIGVMMANSRVPLIDNIKEADTALYHSKETGRNRVTFKSEQGFQQLR